MADPDLRRWVLASGNPGKVREFQAMLSPLGVGITPQHDFGITDADEPHPTFVENALAKARHAAAGSGLPALADDSGICVPALGGAPGVRSARFAADVGVTPGGAGGGGSPSREHVDHANNALLVRLTQPLPQPVVCYYCCVIVFVRHPDDPRPLIAEGLWFGTLLAEPRGVHGFGYDPHFLPDGAALAAAEMEPAVKNRLSHRARALTALLAELKAGG